MMEIRYFTPSTKHYLTQGVGLVLGLANSNMVERPQTTNVDPSPIVILKCRCFISFHFVCLFGFWFRVFSAMCWEWPRINNGGVSSAKQHSSISCQIQSGISTYRRSIDQRTIPIWWRDQDWLWLWDAHIDAKIRELFSLLGGLSLSPVMASGELPDSPGPWRLCVRVCTDYFTCKKKNFELVK